MTKNNSPTINSSDGIYNLTELSKRWSIGRKVLEKIVADSKCPSVQFGSRLYFRESTLLDYIEKRYGTDGDLRGSISTKPFEGDE